MFFATFVQNKLKVDTNSKNLILNSYLELKHPIRCCVFSFLRFFADFLSFMPDKAKNSTFYQIFQFLTFLGMLFKKSAKTHKNERKGNI